MRKKGRPVTWGDYAIRGILRRKWRLTPGEAVSSVGNTSLRYNGSRRAIEVKRAKGSNP